MKKILLPIIFILVTTICNAQWVVLGTGTDPIHFNATINCIVADGSGNVYAAGQFTDANDKTYVAKWDGTSWSELGVGVNALNTNFQINAIAIDKQGYIYVGGQFDDTTGKSYVAKWNGTKWSTLGTGNNALNANDEIAAITIDDSGNVYVGGMFTDTNNNHYVAKWNGTSWKELGTLNSNNSVSANSNIFSLATDHANNIYAAGGFTINTSGVYTNIYGVYYSYVAKWDGTSWSEVGTGANALNAKEAIWSITTDDSGNIYAGGLFADANRHIYVAKWDGTTWSELEGSNALTGNSISSIVVDDSGNVYAAGELVDTSGNYYVAKWNGTSWSNLGTGSSRLSPHYSISALTTNKYGNVYEAYGIYVAKYSPAGDTSGTTDISNPVNSSSLTVYPNPNNGQFTVNLPAAAQVTIYNTLGELIVTENLPKGKQAINLTNKPAGVYYLKANSTTGQQVVKLVVE